MDSATADAKWILTCFVMKFDRGYWFVCIRGNVFGKTKVGLGKKQIFSSSCRQYLSEEMFVYQGRNSLVQLWYAVNQTGGN